jgi:uncharacterized repeat protein (TIGR01451 family)
LQFVYYSISGEKIIMKSLMNSKSSIFCATVTTIIALSISAVIAQNAQNLQISLKALRVVTAADQKETKETLVPAEQVKPGDVVEYQATYTNTASRPLRNLQATVPIPASLEFLPDSAKPTTVLASVDGKTFSRVPLMRQTRAAGGPQKSEAVPYREYRFLRWDIGELSAKKSIVVSARAKVSSAQGK